MHIGSIDDTFATDKEETTHDLAMMKGSDRRDQFPDYSNCCWAYGHRESRCCHKTMDMV